MTSLPNNTPSEQPASQQASPSRQTLESDFDNILHRFLYTFAPDGTVKPKNYVSLDFPQAKAALLKTVDLYVKERELFAMSNMNYMFPRATGKTAYFTDIFIKQCKSGKTAEYHHPDYVVMSRKQYDNIQKKLTSKALRQQVKGGES